MTATAHELGVRSCKNMQFGWLEPRASYPTILKQDVLKQDVLKQDILKEDILKQVIVKQISVEQISARCLIAAAQLPRRCRPNRSQMSALG